jgi:hypothetical protein
VQRIVKKIRSSGLVVLLGNAQGGRGKTSVYQIQPQKGVKLSPFAGKGDIGDTLSESKGCHPRQERVTSEPERVTFVTKKGDLAMSPEPSKNRTVLEPSDKPCTYGAERSATDRSASLVSPPPPQAALIELPLNDGTQYAVQPDDLAEWTALYPAVDVPHELRKMRGWLLANRANRKTRRGIARFINGWLSKEQDRARRTDRHGGPHHARRPPQGAYHSGDPTRTYDREPDILLEVP